MKKVIAVVFVALSAVIGLFAFGGNPQEGVNKNNFLRIHIRANSNSQADQDVKYLVKDAVVDGLTPLFAGAETRQDALLVLENNITLIEQLANQVLAEKGFEYFSKASVVYEFFPTRVYNDVSVDEGFYDALILELGTGTGDNWWCVVYPPLCFLENNIGGASATLYRSKLLEIIRRASK